MTFKDMINQDKPVLVDFFATWCGPCKMMAPVLEKVKKRVGERAAIIKIDVDQSPQAAAAFQIQGVPTFILFKRGKVVWRQSGMIQTHALQQVIEQYTLQ